MSQPLSFHVPQPPARPGEAPDFSYLNIPAAGEARKPDVTANAQDMKDMATAMIRVLDDDGKPVGPWAEDVLDGETLLNALRSMMRTRAFDHRMFQMQRQGKTSFFLKSTGEEAIAVGFRQTMEKGDMAFPTYRMSGLFIDAGYSPELMASQVFSNGNDPLKGRAIPVAYSSKEHGLFSISANLGTQLPQAVGWAMASAISGDTSISSAWSGDGTTAENDFHSALVFASTYKPPVILNVVNNQWAISSFRGIASSSNATFAERAIGYDIPALRVDGNDILAVYAASKWASDRARMDLGPTFIEWVTYRVEAHSTSDDPTQYRASEEAGDWPLGDPIERLKTYLINEGVWSEERHTQTSAEIEEEMRTAIKTAESHGTFGKGVAVEDMFHDVYAEMPAHLSNQMKEAVTLHQSQKAEV